MAGAFVGDGVEFLARRFHELDGFWNRGVDASVVAAVKAEDWAGDFREVLVVGRAAVEYEGRFDVLIVRGEAEGLGAAPAETADDDLAAAAADSRGST